MYIFKAKLKRLFCTPSFQRVCLCWFSFLRAVIFKVWQFMLWFWTKTEMVHCKVWWFFVFVFPSLGFMLPFWYKLYNPKISTWQNRKLTKKEEKKKKMFKWCKEAKWWQRRHRLGTSVSFAQKKDRSRACQGEEGDSIHKDTN